MALTKSTRSQRSGTLFSTVGSTSTVRLNRPFAKGRMGIFGWSETGGPAIHESLHGGLWTPTADTQRRGPCVMEMCKLPLVDGGKLEIVALPGFSRKPLAQKMAWAARFRHSAGAHGSAPAHRWTRAHRPVRCGAGPS